MSTPVVTVLMAVHNGGAYLKAAVHSVLDQTFGDFELLIIDDASSDGALEALKLEKDPRVRIYRNGQNIGQTASLNLGLGLARGELIARMDADDLALSHWLASGVDFLKANPNLAVAGCLALVMDQHSRIYKKLASPIRQSDMILKCLFASPLNHVGSLMRRDVVQKAGGYDATLRIAADYDLWSRLLREGFSIGVNPHIAVTIRAHQASVTASNKGRSDVPEVCRIMTANIKHYCDCELTVPQARIWWSYIYAPELLSVEEFAVAQDLMGHIYTQMKTELVGGSREKVQTFLHQRQRILFVRAMFILAQSGQHKTLRAMMNSTLQRFGFCSFYGTIWCLTLGGTLCAFGSGLHSMMQKCQTLLHR